MQQRDPHKTFLQDILRLADQADALGHADLSAFLKAYEYACRVEAFLGDDLREAAGWMASSATKIVARFEDAACYLREGAR